MIRLRLRLTGAALGSVLALMVTVLFGGIVLAQGPDTFTGCLSDKGTLSRVALADGPVSPCKSDELQVSWNREGPAGPPGSGGATVANLVLWGPGVFGSGCSSSADYNTIGAGCSGSGTAGGDLVSVFEYDSGDYPVAAETTFGAVLFVNSGDSYCVRLFDLTTETAVAGSELCSSNASAGNTYFRLSVSPIDLGAGSLYALQDRHTGAFMGSGALSGAWLAVDWE